MSSYVITSQEANEPGELNLELKHILTANQFCRSDLEYIYKLTNRIRAFDKHKEGLLYLQSLLREKRAMLYFTQASTRTFLSFQSACHILGLQTLEIRDPSTSSEIKGESLDDSIRTFSSYVDLIIMRSAIPDLCDRTAENLNQTPRAIPIINAGSGPNEHPTQAILDTYTLMRSFKGPQAIDGKTICFVGDLKRGRTVRSLAQILCQFDNVKIIFVSPKELQIKDDLRSQLKQNQINFTETEDFEAAIKEADAIYMTRIQDEYGEEHPDEGPENKTSHTTNPKMTPQAFCFTRQHLDIIRPHCIIMHPLPRRNEIDKSVDNDPRAMYWRQERNGMWTRVALITIIFGVANKVLLPDF